MYNYGRGSIRRRLWRIARQRGWLGGPAGNGQGGARVALVVALIILAALAALWTVATVTSLVFALIPWAIVGLLTGWAASKLTGTRLGTGWTILTGIAGSWLGGAIFSGLLGIRVGGLFNPVHLVASVLGAAILITVARAIARPALRGAERPRLGRLY